MARADLRGLVHESNICIALTAGAECGRQRHGPRAASLTQQRQSPAHLAFHSFQLFRATDANFVFVCFQTMCQPSAAWTNSMAKPFSVSLAISKVLRLRPWPRGHKRE
jgi:hypothetical protein